MNIREIIQKDPESFKYASSFKRSTAAMIDIWITLILRTFFMQAMSVMWFQQAVIDFLLEFQAKFGTESVKNTPEHIDFVVNHRVFMYGIIFYGITVLIGAIYHAYFNSSSWRGTIGKRLMKIMIVKKEDEKISFQTGLSHYFLSVLPFAFILYLTSFLVKHGLTFYETITASGSNLILGVIFVLWIQIHLFTKKKTTAYDLICKTTFINGRTKAKWPWKKIEAEEESE